MNLAIDHLVGIEYTSNAVNVKHCLTSYELYRCLLEQPSRICAVTRRICSSAAAGNGGSSAAAASHWAAPLPPAAAGGAAGGGASVRSLRDLRCAWCRVGGG